jgi:uncharacterized membrane protein
MKEDIDINAETTSKYDVKENKSKKNIWGIYIGICLILIGTLWYAVNMGLIPVQYLQSWPQILMVLVGILVVIKSL